MGENLSRRDLFRRVIIHGSITAYATAAVITGGIPFYRGDKEVPPKGDEIATKDYAGSILYTAKKLRKSIHSWADGGLEPIVLASSASAIVASEWAIRRDSKFPPRKTYGSIQKYVFEIFDTLYPRNRSKDRKVFLCSLVATFFGRIADSFSTAAAFSEFNDPRFNEYGFDTYIFEGNPAMNQYPKPGDLLKPGNLLLEILKIGFSYPSPVFGSFVAPGSFMVTSNNIRAVETIQTGYKVGDLVKEKIQLGYTDKQVLTYLNALKPSDVGLTN